MEKLYKIKLTEDNSESFSERRAYYYAGYAYLLSAQSEKKIKQKYKEASKIAKNEAIPLVVKKWAEEEIKQTIQKKAVKKIAEESEAMLEELKDELERIRKEAQGRE